MHSLIIVLVFTCLLLFNSIETSFILQKRQECNEKWVFCSPLANDAWYYHNYYKFTWNQNNTFFVTNNIANFDIHLVTTPLHGYNSTEERSIKSWFNLTSSDESLEVQVNDDWFPTRLPKDATSNVTWTMLAFLLGHESGFSINPITYMDNTNGANSYVQFRAVQTLPTNTTTTTTTTTTINSQDKQQPRTWLLAVIIAPCVLVIIVICVCIWFYKNMQKQKRIQQEQETRQIHPPHQQQQHSSILSTPDAMMIADTFRQVMNNQSDVNEKRLLVGEDLLRRQLQSDQGMSVSEVERRTSSTTKKKNKLFPF